MTDTRPLWLLDVDGVLNVDPGKPRWHAAPRKTKLSPGDGREYTIRWAPELMVRIRKLHVSGAVEIRWATSWIGYTRPLADLLGLPDFEWAYPPLGTTDQTAHQRAKREAFVYAYAVDLRRVIWTDDDAIPGGWLARQDPSNIPAALFIAPASNRGLLPEHMNAIEMFVRQYTPEGAPA